MRMTIPYCLSTKISLRLFFEKNKLINAIELPLSNYSIVIGFNFPLNFPLSLKFFIYKSEMDHQRIAQNS